VANLTVLTIALCLFSLIKNQILQFRILGIIIVAMGTASSLFYIVTLKEPRLVAEAKRI
jgi:hypothetical protein